MTHPLRFHVLGWLACATVDFVFAAVSGSLPAAAVGGFFVGAAVVACWHDVEAQRSET